MAYLSILLPLWFGLVWFVVPRLKCIQIYTKDLLFEVLSISDIFVLLCRFWFGQDSLSKQNNEQHKIKVNIYTTSCASYIELTDSSINK